jgi:hypothetical protein
MLSDTVSPLLQVIAVEMRFSSTVFFCALRQAVSRTKKIKNLCMSDSFV